MSGRIRTVKPEILEDAVTAGLGDTAFRLFIAVIVLSDDYGRFRAEPGWLRGQIYWSRNIDPATFADAIAELGSLVTLYTVNGQRYGVVRNWAKHQRVDKPGKPRIPGPPEVPDDPRETLANVSRDSREDLAPDLRSPITDHRSRITGDEPGVSRAETKQETHAHTSKRERKSGTRKVAAKTPEILLPADFAVTADIEVMCREEGLANPHIVLRDFRDWADVKQARRANWQAAFRRWLRSDLTAKRYRPWNETDPVRPPVVKVEPPPPENVTATRAARAALHAEFAARQNGTGGQ